MSDLLKFVERSHRIVILIFLLLFYSLNGSAQLREINGIVTDQQSVPIAGVSVVLKGGNKGVITDNNGKYALSVDNRGGVIVFSFVGYKTKEVSIENSSVINVVLESNVTAMQDVVVVGFGTQTRADVTTSISKLDNRVLEDIPYTNATSALEGTIPGLRVQSTSGQPGDAPRVILRGGTSINNPNGATPLYIVDGVVRDDMNGINATDIASIQVLKDAASTAIYGSRASNGVIIIVTKTGRPGKTMVNYDYNLTVSQVGREYSLLNGRDYAYYSRIGIARTAALNPAYNDLLTGTTYAGGIGNDLTVNTYNSLQPLTPENEYKLNEGWESMPDPLDPSRTLIFSSTDWQSYLFRTGVSHNSSVSVSGGDEKAAYRLGLGYQDYEGIAVQTGFKRLTMDFSGKIKINKRMNVTSNVLYANTRNTTVSSVSDIFKSALITPPTNKVLFEDGSISPGRAAPYLNPAYVLSTYSPNNKFDDLTISLQGEWNITQGLKFEPQLSFRKQTGYQRNFRKSFRSGAGANTFDISRQANAAYNEFESPQANLVLNYNRSISGEHNIDVTAGYSYNRFNNASMGATGNNAATDIIPTLNASATPVKVDGQESHQIIMGYFSRVSYNYKQKYLIGASVRYDGASNLGKDNHYGLFPGISAGWRIDQEDFWNKIFPNRTVGVKLRASYGLTGNISNLGLYQSQGSYSVSNLYAGNGAIEIQDLPNPDLRWERSKTLDVGADINLLNNRVNIMFDYYRRVTNDLLTTLQLPPSTGMQSIVTNFGSLENKGIEAELNVDILPSDAKVQWNVGFNAATTDAKILKLPANGQENNRVGGVFVFDPSVHKYTWKGGLQEGGRIGDLYGYKQLNVYATDKEAADAPYDVLIPYPDKTKLGGDVNWLDVDKNDTIDSRDQVYMGNPYPTFTGGFSSYLKYKNFSFNFRLDFAVGATVYNETAARIEGNFSGSNALSSKLLRSWSKDGDITDIPKYYWADQNAHWNVWDGRGNSRFFQSTDFLAVREVTIAYDLSPRMLERIKVSKLRFSFTVNNLHYFTSYEGLNPEETASDAAYPNPRNFILGASISF